MAEEEKKTEQPEAKAEQPKNFLDEVKALRDELGKEKEEASKLRDELRELRTRDIMGGSSEVAPPQQKKEVTPKEYAAALMRGEILEIKRPNKEERESA